MIWPEEQALVVINDTTGRYDERTRNDAAQFADYFTRQFARAGTEHANRGEANLIDRQADHYEEVRHNQRKADANRLAVDAGEMTVAEFIAANDRLTARRQMLERMVDGFESHAASIAEIREDPAGWYDAFLQKWPTRSSPWEWCSAA